MANFLFELLVEDIPHGVLPTTSQYITNTLPSLLEKYGVTYKEITYFITPRRLAFYITNLPLQGQERIVEQKGPSLKVAYDQDGNPTRALEGFFHSYNVTQNDIEQREINGQTYIFLQKKEPGMQLSELLIAILQELIKGIKFSNPMRWNHKDHVYEFIRPVRGVTALIDKDILSIELFGIKSNNILLGHRQLSPNSILLNHADDYEKLLKNNGIIPKFEERIHIIQHEVEKIAASLNGHALLDDELLSILASLTENPHPLLANFDVSFLKLPKEVLISEMKIHQKYIPITDKHGHLLPNYIITANIPFKDSDTRQNILSGNDRVLRARFADGQFFFDEDLKKGLQYYANQLASVSFVEGAGTMADKIQRMQTIALYLRDLLAPHIDMDELSEAISLSKADLSSLMVGEFPELQGIIGYYYAKQQGINSNVALAIKEHYYPMNLDGEHYTPTQELSALVGLADRLDNLLTLYAIGKTVTGSRDPYGLRRQTIAIINLLRQFSWEQFSLELMFSQFTETYKPLLVIDIDLWKNSLLEFIKIRLEGILKGENHQVDILNATLSQGIDVILLDIDRAHSLQEIQQKHPEPFTRLVELYKRIANIIKDQDINEINEALLVEPAEKKLYDRYQTIHMELIQLSDKDGLLELVKMESLITEFFNTIMVKTGDEKEKNRLALLYSIHQLFKQYADFSKISS